MGESLRSRSGVRLWRSHWVAMMTLKLMQFGICGLLSLFSCVDSMGAMPASNRSQTKAETRQAQLIQAIWSDDFEAVEKLLQQGLSPNYEAEYEPTTPLVAAIAARQPRIVELLLRYGADVNFGAKDGHVPLCTAAWYGDSDTV